MSLGMVLLGVLTEKPAHGYDLKRAHDDRFPSARPLAYGQVYATLSRLERDGLVELTETTRGAGPDRAVYAITDKGRAELAGWLAAMESAGPYPAEELVRKTITALHLGADADGFLARQRASHLAAMRRLTLQRAEAAELGARLAIDHTLAASRRRPEMARGNPRAGRSGHDRYRGPPGRRKT